MIRGRPGARRLRPAALGERLRRWAGRWPVHAGTVCALCGAAAELPSGLCRGCRQDLPSGGHGCRRCALPLAGGDLCGRCLQRPPPFDRVVAPFVYRPPMDTLIHGAKYHRRLSDARSLGVLLAEHVADACTDPPELIVPVPLHGRRLRERGYNQALEIARPAARRLGVRLDAGCCVRTRATSPQARLDGPARRRNIAGAFAVTRVPQVSHVAVVDDVMTTGGTAAELAEVLIRAGVVRIDIWVCARAPEPW